jgi:hypothetical protein
MRPRKDAEVARLLEYLRTTDKEVVRFQSVAKLHAQLKLQISLEYTRKLISQFYKDVKANKEVSKMPEKKQPVTAETVLLELAAIAAKTYAYVGDQEKVSSEDAAKGFVKVMKNYDPTLLERGLRRQLPK